MGLLDIFHAIEVRIKEWRHNEVEKDFNNYGEYEVSLHNDILIHASNVYSFRLFKDFQEQFSYAVGAKFKLVSVTLGVECFQVSLGRRDPRKFSVKFDPLSKTVDCSCKFFSQQGFLCAHAIRILDLKGEEKIPEQYILKRWSKNARTYSNELMGRSDGQERLQRFCWRTNTARECYNLFARCMNDPAERKRFDEGFCLLKRAVLKGNGDMGAISTTIGARDHIRNPEFVKTNTFGRKRVKSMAERFRSQNKRSRK